MKLSVEETVNRLVEFGYSVPINRAKLWNFRFHRAVNSWMDVKVKNPQHPDLMMLRSYKKERMSV